MYTSYGHEYKSICIIVSCILTNLIHMINVYLLYQFRNHTQPLPSPSSTFVMSSLSTMMKTPMIPAVLLKITPPIYPRMITMKTRRTLSMPRRERVSLCHAELNTSFCLFIYTHTHTMSSFILDSFNERKARARGYASGACGGKPMRFCRCKRVGFCSRKKKCGRGLKRCRKNRKRCCKRSSEEDELIMARFFETYEDEDIDLITDYLFNIDIE